MYKAAKKAWKYAQITLLRHAEVTGSAATWAFTLAGTATKSGKVSVICNGVEYAVGVAKTDAPGTIADALANVINNTPDAPFTAVATTEEVTDQTTHETSNVATGEVVLTAKCKGAYISASAGGLNVSVASEAEGITAGSITPTAGDSAAAPLEQRGQRAICAMVSATASSAASVAIAKNYERLHIAAVKNKINATVWEIAAGLGAIFASNSKPNIPMNGVAIPGLAIPDVEDKWSGDEQDTLLNGGVIPLVEDDSMLCIVRAVTTRTKNSGAEWNKLNDTGVIASLDYFRDCILAMHKSKYKNKVIHAFLADALNEDNKAVASDLEDEQILRYIDDYADQFITQESKNVPGRMLCQIPAPVVPGLNQIYSTIDLYL